MDRYLFRGFHKDENGKETIYLNGEEIKGRWVYGDLIQLFEGRRFIIDNKFGACIDDKGNFINTEAPYVNEVIPETVGQGTILKNGLKIFVGDIYHHGDPNITYIVVWHDSELIGKQNKSTSYAGLEAWADRIRIIGNKFDDGELIC